MNPPVRHAIRIHPPLGPATSPVPEALVRLLSRFYHLGEITLYHRVTRGQVNTGHIVETERGQKRSKYFIRQYHPDRKIAEIEFEHALIDHLVTKKFEYVGGVIRTTSGQTYVPLPVDKEGNGRAEIFAVFEYLTGEVRYDWTPPGCDLQSLENAAMVLARYHQAVADWRPVNGWARPGIVEQLSRMETTLRTYRQMAGDTPFDACLRSHLDLISRAGSTVLAAFRTPAFAQLPRLAIHGDFHPGNLTFEQDRIRGLFDFDWARMDARCFDVALAIFYFCARWQAGVDGQLDMGRVGAFLDVYQRTLEQDQGLKGLNRMEWRFLPDMILAADIYILGWVLSDFYTDRVDVDRYTGYLRHGVNYIRWAEENNDKPGWKDILSRGGAI
jgi:homoserine kinase type II